MRILIIDQKYKIWMIDKISNLTTQEDAEEVVRQSLYCSRSSTFNKKIISRAPN